MNIRRLKRSPFSAVLRHRLRAQPQLGLIADLVVNVADLQPHCIIHIINIVFWICILLQPGTSIRHHRRMANVDSRVRNR